MHSNRLGCLTGSGILAALITSVVIAGISITAGGSMFSPGPLSTQRGETLGGVTYHAEISYCKACHTAPWESAKMADRCAVCHTGVATQMQSVASMHGSMLHDNPDLGCRHCHPDHRGANAPLTELNDAAFPHEAVGYSLKGHQLTALKEPFDCRDCHREDISQFALAVCEECHRQMDPLFLTAHTISFGSICLDCHDGLDSLVTNFNHNKVTFKTAGKHADVECVLCHVDARRLADFESTSQECQSCHRRDDPHDGRFGMECGACYSVDGWTPANFDHALALFQLEGKHVEIECEQCHINNVYPGTPSDCYSCHRDDDEHGGKYGTDCAACHQPADWDDVTFDHNKSNFPLTGAHNGLVCEQCHVSGQFSGLSTDCVACHADPVFHAGMFGLNCAQCHTTDNWFAPYNGPHPGIADEGGSGVNHGGVSCRTCHTQTLSAATCGNCHEGNNPEGGEGGEGGGGD